MCEKKKPVCTFPSFLPETYRLFLSLFGIPSNTFLQLVAFTNQFHLLLSKTISQFHINRRLKYDLEKCTTILTQNLSAVFGQKVETFIELISKSWVISLIYTLYTCLHLSKFKFSSYQRKNDNSVQSSLTLEFIVFSICLPYLLFMPDQYLKLHSPQNNHQPLLSHIGKCSDKIRMSNNIMFSKESMFWGWLGIKSRILELFLGILLED